MGLDWCLVNKAKEGHAEEAESLRKALNALNDGSEFSERLECLIRRRLVRITVLPCEAVQAPKVKDGQDWQKKLAEILEEHKRREIVSGRGDSRWQKVTLNEFLKDNAEKYDCEACPAKSEVSGAFCRPCEFRGKIIGYMEFLDGLAEEAYEDMGLAIQTYAMPMKSYPQDIKLVLCLTDGACNDAIRGKEIYHALRAKVEVIGILLDPDDATKGFVADMFGQERVIACRSEELPQKLGNILRAIRGV